MASSSIPVRTIVGRQHLLTVALGLLVVLSSFRGSAIAQAAQGLPPISNASEREIGGAVTSLTVLIEEARRNNPNIRAAELAAKAATNAAPQVSALPDPQFTLQQFS